MWFAETPVFVYVVLPLLIFLARLLDVSIGTLRIVFIARRNAILASALGFFEVLIWLLAISQVFKHLDNVVSIIAYAAGFATGNYVGMMIEQKLAMGMQVVRIIIQKEAETLVQRLKEAGFRSTAVDGEGQNGAVKIIFSLIRRKQLPRVIELVMSTNPHAFYTVEDVHVANDPTPLPISPTKGPFLRQLFKMDRKRK